MMSIIKRADKTGRFFKTDRLAIHAHIIQLIVGYNLSITQVMFKLGVSKDTVSKALSKYLPTKPENPVTIVLQSKINYEQEDLTEINQ